LIDFIFFEIDASTTKDDVISPTAGKKVMDQASRLSFLNQFGPTSVQRRDTDSLSIETKQSVDITIHPNGSFHFESIKSSIKTLVTIERWISKIAGLFKRYNAKTPLFDINFRSHSDIESKTQLTAVSRIFTALRTTHPLTHIQQDSTPTYIVTRVKPASSTKSMFISYHPEFVELYFTLKPLTPNQMKNRFLITPAEALIGVLTREIGDS